MKRTALSNDTALAIFRGSESPATAAPDTDPSNGASTQAREGASTTLPPKKRKAVGRRSPHILKALYLDKDDVSLIEEEVMRRKRAARKAGEDVRGIDSSALVREAIRKTYGRS